ncbi:MAG: hypothetical protein WCD79_14495 [Chthoniobacteraceae bacterium]
MSWTLEQFYGPQVKQLVESHRKIKQFPLKLAIWFDLDKGRDIHLFEVVDDYPHSEERQKFFSTKFQSTISFPMPQGGYLELIITSPDEVQDALGKSYKQLANLRNAFRRNAARVIYCSPTSKELLQLLKSAK